MLNRYGGLKILVVYIFVKLFHYDPQLHIANVYRQEVRFNLAVPLRRDKSFTISEIAYDLSFIDASHFSRSFKRITGMYPSHYRYMLME